MHVRQKLSKSCSAGWYHFRFLNLCTVKIHLSQFTHISLAIFQGNSFTREAGSVDPGAVHGNYDTVDLGERVSWSSICVLSKRLMMWFFHDEAGDVIY